MIIILYSTRKIVSPLIGLCPALVKFYCRLFNNGPCSCPLLLIDHHSPASFRPVLHMQWATQRASWSWAQSEDQRIRGQCKLRRWRFSWQSVILKSQARYWRGFESLVRQGIFLPELISNADSFGVRTAPVCSCIHQHLHVARENTPSTLCIYSCYNFTSYFCAS